MVASGIRERVGSEEETTEGLSEPSRCSTHVCLDTHEAKITFYKTTNESPKVLKSCLNSLPPSSVEAERCFSQGCGSGSGSRKRWKRKRKRENSMASAST